MPAAEHTNFNSDQRKIHCYACVDGPVHMATWLKPTLQWWCCELHVTGMYSCSCQILSEVWMAETPANLSQFVSLMKETWAFYIVLSHYYLCQGTPGQSTAPDQNELEGVRHNGSSEAQWVYSHQKKCFRFDALLYEAASWEAFYLLFTPNKMCCISRSTHLFIALAN